MQPMGRINQTRPVIPTSNPVLTEEGHLMATMTQHGWNSQRPRDRMEVKSILLQGQKRWSLLPTLKLGSRMWTTLGRLRGSSSDETILDFVRTMYVTCNVVLSCYTLIIALFHAITTITPKVILRSERSKSHEALFSCHCQLLHSFSLLAQHLPHILPLSHSS